MAKYKDVDIHEKLNLWYHSTGKRSTAGQLARECNFSGLQNIAPAILRISRFPADGRPAEIEREAERLNNVSLKALKTLCRAAFQKPETSNEKEMKPEPQSELPFQEDEPDGPSLEDQIKELPLYLGSVESFAGRISSICNGLGKKLEEYEKKRLEMLLMLQSLVYFADLLASEGFFLESESILNDLCRPFFALYGMPKSESTISRIREHFPVVATEINSSKRPNGLDSPDFAVWWTKLVKNIKSRCRLGLAGFESVEGHIRELPGATSIVGAHRSHRHERPGGKHSEPENQDARLESRIAKFNAKKPRSQTAAIEQSVGVLAQEAKFLARAARGKHYDAASIRGVIASLQDLVEASENQ